MNVFSAPAHSDEQPTSRARDNPAYLREQLITCIGNKRALLGMLADGFEQVRSILGKERIAIADLFAGSGVVSRLAKRYASHLVVNDLERYAEIVNTCYLANRREAPVDGIADGLAVVERSLRDSWSPGFIAELYAPADDTQIVPGERVFYTRRNAIYLDTARSAIAALPERVQPFLLGPLLSEASVHANTAGVFKGFYKNAEGVGQFGGRGRNALGRILGDIELRAPVFSDHDCAVDVVRGDANALAGIMEPVDVAYLDPPYNQHPYGSNYFMLNLISDYERPERISRVSGIPADWTRSAYNKAREAEAALCGLIESCPARFLMISYNSEGFVEQARFLEWLGRFGPTRTVERRYNAFRGSRNLSARDTHVTEHLYLLDKRRRS